MTDVRWQLVKALFQATVDRPPAERAAFLAAATGPDDALWQQVESLLSSDAEDASFLDWVPRAAEGVLAGVPDLLKTAGGSVGERWLQIKQLFDASLCLKPHERQACLTDACKDDIPLRQEVELLIDSVTQSSAFLEDPAQPGGNGRAAWRAAASDPTMSVRA